MPPVLSTLRRDFKQRQCERGGHFDRPPISFIPNDPLLDESHAHELAIRVSETKSNNTIRVRVPILAMATPEEFLDWEDQRLNVIRRKPCSTALSKFDMTEILLSGEAKSRWKEVVREVMETESASIQGAAGATEPAPGRTDETFASCLARFKATFFAKNAIRTQKNYLRNHVKKPGHMLSRICENRLRELNGLLAKFPGGDHHTPMPEDELSDIYIRMAPRKFQETLRSTKSPDDMSLLEIAEYFEILETMQTVDERKAQQEKAPDDSSSENPSAHKGCNRKWHKRSGSNGKPSGKPEATNRSASGKWCTFCADHGGRPETHQTTD